MEAFRLLNIVISILKPKELAVILGRWNLAEARKYMPEGRVDMGSCTPYGKKWWGEAALPLLSGSVSSWRYQATHRKSALCCVREWGSWNPHARVLVTLELLPWTVARESRKLHSFLWSPFP